MAPRRSASPSSRSKKEVTTTSDPLNSNTEGMFPAFLYCCIFVVVLWFPVLYMSVPAEVRSVSVSSAALYLVGQLLTGNCWAWLLVGLSLFNCVNVLICVWEICLHLNLDTIARQHADFKAKWGTTLPKPLFLFDRASVAQVLSLKWWSLVWSTYCTLDASYATERSFGFWVDSSNGFITLLPSLLLNAAMVRDDMFLTALLEPLGLGGIIAFISQPRLVAMVGTMMNWQCLNGTITYFWAYIRQRRYKGHGWDHRIFVAVVNGIWIVFPALGLYIMWQTISSGNWSHVRA